MTATIDQIRSRVSTGEREDVQKLKKRLPLLVFMAGDISPTTDQRGRRDTWRRQEATRLNGLYMVDFDHVGTHEDTVAYARQVMQKYVAQCDILLIHVTPSGEGLRVVAKASRERGNLSANQHWLGERLGLRCDEACKDASRGSFCPRLDDIIYIDDELFTYDNPDYDQEFGGAYRLGNSRNSDGNVVSAAPACGAAGQQVDNAVAPDAEQAPGTLGADDAVTLEKDEEGNYVFGRLPYNDIQAALWQAYGGRPAVGARHTGVLAMAGRLRYICDNKVANILAVIDGCGLPRGEVSDIVTAVVGKPMAPYVPPKVRSCIEDLCKQRNLDSPFSGAQGDAGWRRAATTAADPVDYAYWGERLKPLVQPWMDDFLHALPADVHIGGCLAAFAMLGTYLTRCTFLHGDGEQRRLSFLVYIIGMPAAGKSFMPRLDRLIMEPMRVADDMGRREEQRYKEDLKKRESSSKNSKTEAMDVPHPVIRYVPSTISNAMLYTRLRDAKETVNGEELHLHLYTCEAELATALRSQTGGAWAQKADLECKSFQNEEAGVDYKNAESANGTYQINWNQVITGTPDALRRKFKQGDALNGLTTRVAIFPMPEHRFEIRPLKLKSLQTFEEESRLRSWGYRLDRLYGELVCPRLVESAWQWLEEVSREAEENDDVIADFFDKRVTMYYVRYALVYNVMRDLDYLEQLLKEGKPLRLRIGQKDLDFGRLMADFILMMQIRMFGQMTWNALENEKKDFVPRKRLSKYDDLYKLLPTEFDAEKLMQVYGVEKGAANQHIARLEKRGYVKRKKRGTYKKLVL